jgi:hypothetical protein
VTRSQYAYVCAEYRSEATPRFRIPSGMRALMSAYHHARRPITSATLPSVPATMSAGTTRRPRKRIGEALLALRWIDRDVDAVRPLPPGEPGKRRPTR